jgi:hypothetical protein
VADWGPFAGLVSGVVAIITWAPWYSDILRVNRLAAPRGHRTVLLLTPIVCLVFLLLSLERSAAKAVRESAALILIYTALGAATLGVSSHLFPFLGISPRDDVLERHGSAGLIAIVGALVGPTLCFVGGNIGKGPGIEVVLASAGAALCLWFVLWYLADLLSAHVISERVAVERDTGSGLRLAGLLAGNGIVLGAAAAGEWVPDRFLHDFALSAWPAWVLTAAAIFVERFLSSRFPSRHSGLTASGYLLPAVVWVLHRGLRA